jgi:hypothetical protein
VLQTLLLLVGVLSPAPPQPASDGPVRALGHFSNMRYTEEHAYGYSLLLWRQGDRIFGLLLIAHGMQADFPTAPLENVRFDPKTGRLSFEATQHGSYRFTGALQRRLVSGLLEFTFQDLPPTMERVRLRRDREASELLSDYRDFAAWKAYADAALKRSRPPR